MLSEEETQIIQESYASLYENADVFSVNFYNNLFEAAPEIRTLFDPEITQQGRKFMEVLSMIILDLRDEELIVPLIRNMGRRHVGYGTKPAHYKVVGQALIATLDQAFEGQWSAKEKSLWIKLYTHISKIMITAAAELDPESN